VIDAHLRANGHLFAPTNLKPPTSLSRLTAWNSAGENDGRGAAVIARGPVSHEIFYYSVTTTGVYCRPSCGRLPRRESVLFHKTLKEAEGAGFRPCKRCEPDASSLDEQHTAKIVAARRFIEDSPEVQGLQQLAARAGLSTFHFHRLFKATTGLTPRGFAAAYKAKRLRHELSGAVLLLSLSMMPGELEQRVLRSFEQGVGDDALKISFGWRTHGHSFHGRRMFARVYPGGQ
jgi:methylphosphotriester-DNA--protein-cysteine methyltransferase